MKRAIAAGLAALALMSCSNNPGDFDLQGHRGARGEFTEESRQAFERALEVGVDTLELDVVMTADHVPAVWHDPIIEAEKCSGEYVGKPVRTLTFEQLQTLDCGKQLTDFPDASVVENNKILQLDNVFKLAKDHEVRFNIETKIEAEKPELSAPPQEFVDAIVASADRFGRRDDIMIQSFDWSSLELVPEGIERVALYDSTTFTPNSVWLGSATYDDGVVAAAQSVGATVLSPDYELVDQDLVNQTHAEGMKLIPWTVNDVDTARSLKKLGCDGIITDYPGKMSEAL
ncbi:glycerophosphodiester phosphodiesterase family protein [Corynebacterium gerontici]|uniref:Cytoplasmic glycerophosphodiester phosphodiesterase n=1 Tax=Corynebacterium gerontici TaxID=2079234 RepID=A0A3G6IYQ9_9CORY|nr:glycerophosphodiester phosphodiesterase family protein [Corynebacterium gerontici]AZA10909.1 cytoplasmic glycerophosphodiester phosphodiesterase [Corynebacterium gerontici]